MKSVRDELAEALVDATPWTHDPVHSRIAAALARHFAEPDDRPRLLAVLARLRQAGKEYALSETAWRCKEALAACSDIETP